MSVVDHKLSQPIGGNKTYVIFSWNQNWLKQIAIIFLIFVPVHHISLQYLSLFLYNNQAGQETFDRIQERTGYEFLRSQIVTAYRRNQNLGDILIKSTLD